MKRHLRKIGFLEVLAWVYMFFAILFADPIIAFLSPEEPILQFGFFRFVMALVMVILLAAHWHRIVFVKNWREGLFFGAKDKNEHV